MRTRIGTDIIVIQRVEESLEKFGERFLERFLNEDEIALAKKVETIVWFLGSERSYCEGITNGDWRGTCI